MRQGERAARQGSPARADLYRRLRDAILGADYKPGEPLSENALAQRFGVSRTPVRDALARLSDEGLVEVFPQRGSAVSRISADRVRQLVHPGTQVALYGPVRALKNSTSSAVSSNVARTMPSLPV